MENILSSESSGPKNQPYFAANGAPEIDVDPGLVADYAAKVGNRRVGTTAERNAAAGKDLWESLIWGDTSDGNEYKRTGSAWIRQSAPVAMAAGRSQIVTPAGSGSSVTVNLPAGSFSVPPIITVSMGADSEYMSNRVLSVWSKTATSFVVGLSNSGAADATVDFEWIAVQMRIDAAAG